MTYREFLLLLKLTAIRKMAELQILLLAKVKAEENGDEFFIDTKTSQHIEIGCREWKTAEDRFVSLFSFVKKGSIDLSSIIPESHQAFTFDNLNLN
jgi:hypothetical protein